MAFLDAWNAWLATVQHELAFHREDKSHEFLLLNVALLDIWKVWSVIVQQVQFLLQSTHEFFFLIMASLDALDVWFVLVQ